ncbi:protein kinase [Chlorogloeopsis sp. ULAP01]|uniref:serine/threonine-protein kinase n=1 Tax=Chlorogloeopsis sp. ULAP01 TaxID=3056483 RepID=UPI0025AB252E|nr:serine/threonine-protein kinase [Chlorogloeopsis sp. ULAP01]MDM9381834.1 protein kinase [Chlorogloeopsis sp. ULAP01]
MLQSTINNRYKIVKVLGEGGFGKTFLAEDTHLPSGRCCVIKQLKPVTNNPQIYQMVQDRFRREAAILEDLGNSNNRIPNLYAYFSEQDNFYLVQEYIEGKTLTEKVQTEGVMNESAVREILKSLLYVLNFVHSRHIIHRDIKPDNIILRSSDNIPVLIDFGAVRESMGTVLNSQGNPTSSIVIGTPGFMPPEQAAGRPVYSSDLYSLALTMIYLLTGKMPHELETDPRTANIIWHQYAINVSPSLRMILDRAIAYNPGVSIAPSPEARYATAREMIDALQSPAADYVAPTVPSFQYNSGKYYSPPPTVVNSGGNPPQYISPSTPTNSRSNSSASSNPPQYVSPGTPINSDSMWVGGGGTFNTSVSVPLEIQGWNWGAFLISPLWCLTNQVWIGLISWIPYLGLPMPFILGAKGNVWAWRSRQWRSVQDFKAHQRAWAKAAIIVYSSFAALFILLAFIGANLPEEDNSSNTNNSSLNQSNSSPNPTPSQSDPPSSSNSTTETGIFEEVEISNLDTYTYKTGLFSIDIPQGWTLKDNSNANEVIIYWLDNTKNALVQVNVFIVERELDQEQLTTMLKNFINNFAASQTNLTMNQPVRQSDNSVRITWRYTTQTQGFSGRLTVNSFIKHQGNKVSIDSYVVPSEQYEKLLPAINQVIGSYKLNASAPLNL